MQRALNLDASPPLSYALRFFITAPAFIFFAALLLLYAGPNALTSRWHPSILAITHLLALGAVAQTMIGALLQILPVATGIHIFHQGWPVWVIYLGLNIGTLLLAQAFLSYQPFYFIFATLSLTLSFFVFLSFSIWGLWRDREQQTKGAPTILRAVRFAIIALIVTVFLGVILTSHFIIS